MLLASWQLMMLDVSVESPYPSPLTEVGRDLEVLVVVLVVV